MAWWLMDRVTVFAAFALATMPAPASAAIVFQQTVYPVHGVATFDFFDGGSSSTDPNIVWIGIDNGRLVSSEAEFSAVHIGLFWQQIPDYSEAGSHPELYYEDYVASARCESAIGTAYCAYRNRDPNLNRPLQLTTRMNGNLLEADWKGWFPYNHCEPFNGVYDAVCARYSYGNFLGSLFESRSYRLIANATDRVTFTIYDAVPAGGAVPEPATWMLLITGFGLTGAALRRQAAMRA